MFLDVGLSKHWSKAHQKLSKRLIKSPKLYFFDPGLATSLLGIEEVKQIHTQLDDFWTHLISFWDDSK